MLIDNCTARVDGVTTDHLLSFFSFLRVQTGPGVHSASCKISIGDFPGVKTAEHRTNHPTSC